MTGCRTPQSGHQEERRPRLPAVWAVVEDTCRAYWGSDPGAGVLRRRDPGQRSGLLRVVEDDRVVQDIFQLVGSVGMDLFS